MAKAKKSATSETDAAGSGAAGGGEETAKSKTKTKGGGSGAAAAPERAPVGGAAKATAGASTGGDATSPKSTAKSATTAKHPAGKAPAAKSGNAPRPTGTPLIDTSLAAEAAAKMVAHRSLLDLPVGGSGTQPAPAAGQQPAARQESSAFRQMKENLNKPAGGGLGNLLGPTQTQKKSNQSFGGGNQVGRNQTFGSGSKINVPRRTGG